MSGAIELQDRWLSIGAVDKVTSVELLARDLGIESVLEVGCGTGAVLGEIVRRGIGSEFAGCEPSPGLFAHARARTYGADVDLRCATFEASEFGQRQWDLILVSHVLEHMNDPAALVVQVLGAARYVIFEVPIEGTRMGGLRSRIRRRVTGRKRTDNAAGHIQFFSVLDVRRLVHWAGGRVLRSRTYFPESTFRHMAREAVGLRRLYFVAWVIAHRILGPRLLLHLYYGHFAVLAGRGSLDDESAGPHPLFWHPGAS